MSDAARESVLRLVRRARRRLEIQRAVKAAARGGLAGGGAGLVLLAADKLAASWSVPPLLPWGFLLIGMAVGAGAALIRGHIGFAAAALFLDARLGTRQGIVTVLTRPRDAYTDRVAAGLAPVLRLPRMALPREASIVPAALFLLFAAGLVPAAGAVEPERARAASAAASAAGEPAGAEVAEPLGIPEPQADLLERLRRGQTPSPAESTALERAIEIGLHRPEDRREARRALARALAGDPTAARGLAASLARLRGAAGGVEERREDPASVGVSEEEKRGGLVLRTAYPEAGEFLRRYREVLAREEQR